VSEDPLEPTPLDPQLDQEMTGTVVRGAGMAAVGFGLAQVLTLGFYLVLARLATPADFGEFAAASIVVNTSFLLSEGGMLSALIHREGEMDSAANTAVVATALSGLGFSLVALAAAPLLGRLFDSHRIGELAAAMSGLLLVHNLTIVPQALLQRRFSFLRRMVVEPAQVVAFGIVAVIATSNNMGPWGLVLGYYASALTSNLLSWGLVRWRPRPRSASMPMWREMMGYGRTILASHAILRAGEQVPAVLLGRFVGTGALGQYRYADRLASTPFSLILAAGAYVLFPAFSRIRDDRDRFRSAVTESLRWLSVIAFPLGLILIPLGPPLAETLFGSVWHDAGQACVALAAYPVAATMVSLTSEVLKADGRLRPLVGVITVTVVASTAAMIALLGLDLTGVALGISIGWSIGAAYALYVTGRELGIGLGRIGGQLLAPAVAAAAMVGVVLPLDRLVLDPTSHGTAAALGLIGAEGVCAIAVYALVLLVLRPALPAELRSIVSRSRRSSLPI
jgi:PST family polysaccharide transporter